MSDPNLLLSDPNLLVLDVRGASEFGAGHYPNAVNVPVGEVAGRCVAVIGADRSRPVLCYCAAGARSATAAAELRNQGYINVISCTNFKEAESLIARLLTILKYMLYPFQCASLPSFPE